MKKEKKKKNLYVEILDKAKILSRDLFYFCSLNGIFVNSLSSYLEFRNLFSSYSEFIKKYIEILFMSYTDKDIEIKNIMFKNRNFLKEFEYFDFFMMLELNYSDLKKLFNDEYKIENLKCEEEISDKLIVLLKNVLDWIKENIEKKYSLENILLEEKINTLESILLKEKINTLESILLIISKLNLKETKFKK